MKKTLGEYKGSKVYLYEKMAPLGKVFVLEYKESFVSFNLDDDNVMTNARQFCNEKGANLS